MSARFDSDVDMILLVIFLYALYRVCRMLVTRLTISQSQAKTNPLGPPGYPFVGNAYQIPQDRQWLKFDEWIKQYGTPLLIL